MYKQLITVCCLCLWAACQRTDSPQEIEVDLNETEAEIAYSGFAESVEYVTLNLTDSLPVGGVERLYFDSGRIFVEDSGNGGILIFDGESGRLIKRMETRGEGPEEIRLTGAFCLNPYKRQLCVFDKGDMKIKTYDYDGNFLAATPTEHFFLDMACLEGESMTCFYPIYASHEQPDGVWSADLSGHRIRQIDSHVTEDCRFHYFPMMYNRGGDCTYYYDRNWDELSAVTADSLRLLYSFHIRQAIPLSVKGKRDLSPQDLDERAIVHHFACSEHFILMSFHTFHQSDMGRKDFTWMLLDRRTGQKTVSKCLTNDLTDTGDKAETHSLFYKDNRTWVRVDDSADDTIRLEILHLR